MCGHGESSDIRTSTKFSAVAGVGRNPLHNTSIKDYLNTSFYSTDPSYSFTVTFLYFCFQRLALLMARPEFRTQLLHPRYWATWFGLGVWFLLGALPYRVQLFLGKVLGRMLARAAPRRRKIAYANVSLCFPELDEPQRQKLVDEVMESVGIAFFETGMAWFWPVRRLRKLMSIEGIEHLEAAKQDGVGVVLMALHFTHIDIGAKLLGLQFSIDGSYRPHKNAVFDYIQRTGRERHTMEGHAMPREDVRGMVKALRKGRAIWYAPDQDYGRKHSIFVPFFGVPAATLSAMSQLARLGKARVIPFTQTRKSDGSGYQLTVHPPLSDFPSGDEYQDCVAVNGLVETLIQEQPGQYLWVHRRFKTRPEGDADLYQPFGIERKTKRKMQQQLQ